MQYLRLIVGGALVGWGACYRKNNIEFDGLGGAVRANWRSVIATVLTLASYMLVVTYKLHEYLPKTPRVINLVTLPRNILFSTYLLVSLLVPFLFFVASPIKSLKGLFQSLLLFVVGILVGYAYLLLSLPKITTALAFFRYAPGWNPAIFVFIGVASILCFFV